MHTSSRSLAGRWSTGVPNTDAYQTGNRGRNKTMSYFMVGTLGALTASGAKSTVADILSNMGASADVLALAKVEVEMGSIPLGELKRSGRERQSCGLDLI
jgi:ubiquinol-cytochrome c reductase iron-sulfur subunit